jgi:hypothetical protein
MKAVSRINHEEHKEHKEVVLQIADCRLLNLLGFP